MIYAGLPNKAGRATVLPALPEGIAIAGAQEVQVVRDADDLVAYQP